MGTRFFIIVLLFTFLIVGMRCNKEKPPKAIVTVVDTLDKPIAGATVKIYADPKRYQSSDTTIHYSTVGYFDPDQKQLYDIKTTDNEGKTYHDFKYEAIFYVYAYKLKKIAWNKYDTLKGYGALILRNNETYEEKVILRKKN
ncbi:MAG: hypothetical protein N3A01_06670 [Bacteroidales bacterium]|nr:hypothetical protein [Bacteroidales bacterium]